MREQFWNVVFKRADLKCIFEGRILECISERAVLKCIFLREQFSIITLGNWLEWLLINLYKLILSLFFIKLFTTSKTFLILKQLNINLKLSLTGCDQARYVRILAKCSIIEVDFEYLKNLHDLHGGLPFLPERMKINQFRKKNMLLHKSFKTSIKS